MQTKQIILIVIVVVALAIAGFFGYKATLGSSVAVPQSTNVVSGVILPDGSNLDFSTIKKFNKNDKLFPYPKVNPSDIGQELSGLMNQ